MNDGFGFEKVVSASVMGEIQRAIPTTEEVDEACKEIINDIKKSYAR